MDRRPKRSDGISISAGDEDLTHSFAKELAGLHPDVIIGHSTPVVAALLQATLTIPIVFVVVSDPIGSGFVTSLARPGGNVTGFTNLQATITGKYLSILRLLVPNLTRVAIMYNPKSATNSGKYYFPSFMEAAKQFHVTPIATEVHSTTEIETALTDFGTVPGSALIVMPDNFTSLNRKLIVAQTERLRIPTIYPYRYFVDEGGLLSYGVDVPDLFRRAPNYVDRISAEQAGGAASTGAEEIRARNQPESSPLFLDSLCRESSRRRRRRNRIKFHLKHTTASERICQIEFWRVIDARSSNRITYSPRNDFSVCCRGARRKI